MMNYILVRNSFQKVLGQAQNMLTERSGMLLTQQTCVRVVDPGQLHSLWRPKTLKASHFSGQTCSYFLCF